MKRKSIRSWIRENRAEIDRIIRLRCPNIGRLNDNERRLWVLNDERLYRWAKSERVNL